MRVAKTLTADEVVEMLKKKQGDKSLRQFADELGISAPYLSDIYRGNRAPGESVLERLGLEKTPASAQTYRRKLQATAAD